MRIWIKKASKKLLISGSFLLAACGQYSSPEPKEVFFDLKAVTTTTTGTLISPSTSTTMVESLPTTVPETTTTTEPILCPGYNHPLHHLTCEEAAERTAVRQAPVVAAPRATLTPTIAASAPTRAGGEALRACIAHYESTSGLHPNIYQFEQGTWEAYGGRGNPSNASYEEQTRIFWLAWVDAGPHHWLAQKGRCF